MRILVISQYFYPENFRINDICIGLKEQGHSVSVLTAKPNYPKGKFFKGYNLFNKPKEVYQGIEVFRSPIIPRGTGTGIKLFINYTSFIIFGILRVLFLNKKFDKVFVYAPSPITVGYIGIIASIKFRAKSYLWVHDLWPESVKDAGGINNKFLLHCIDLMTRNIYLFYNTILVQSPYFTDYLVEQRVNKNKIIYYPYYAENFYRVIKPKKEIKSFFGDTLNIVFAGNIGVAQSFDTIIDAAKILKKILPNFKFIIIGDGRDRARVEQKISEYSLEENFNFLGSYPPNKMSDFFACADALLVTLKDTKIFSLTIPGKLQSYLACGKPIIASLNGIGAKIIVESKSGLVSKSEDSKGLADSIIEFSNLNDSDRKQFGLNARDYFEKEFERKRLLKRLIDIFEK
ncbi:MAG: glycosyltransferase family 4 protein [Candidatus Marinimicrobia bacterium]|nr:glycosyltransferase family 4 protein [Candidatus Neomarinimicrobiota bacterium]